jgi:hypothetical protein
MSWVCFRCGTLKGTRCVDLESGHVEDYLEEGGRVHRWHVDTKTRQIWKGELESQRPSDFEYVPHPQEFQLFLGEVSRQGEELPQP